MKELNELLEPKGKRKVNVDRVIQALEVVGVKIRHMSCFRSGDYHLSFYRGKPACIVGVHNIQVASQHGGYFKNFNLPSERGIENATQALWTLAKKTKNSGNIREICSKKGGRLERDSYWSVSLTATYEDSPFRLPGQDYAVFARFFVYAQWNGYKLFTLDREAKTILLYDPDTVAMVRGFLLEQVPEEVFTEYIFEKNEDLNELCNPN